MSKCHIVYIMFAMSREALDTSKFNDSNVKKIVEVMLKVYALKQISEDP